MKTTYRFADLVVKFIIAVALAIMCERGNAQHWQDTNRGLYPQSIQATLNAKNTAAGIRYGYIFQKQPLGVYASFSNTIAPDMDYNNYEWERKYSLGGMITLPYVRDMRGTHTFFTLGLVYNEHPTSTLVSYDSNLYFTSDFGCDVGMEFQLHHFKAHLTVDVVNFMRYVEFGAGFTFFKLRK